MNFDQKDALAIAKKLRAEIKPGRRHDIAIFRHEGKHIAAFGIRRGSKEQGHDYINKNLFLSNRQCREFCDCSLSLEAYIALLQAKNPSPLN